MKFIVKQIVVLCFMIAMFSVMPVACTRHPQAKIEFITNTPVALFDGVSLRGWRATGFDRAGDISVQDSAIILQRGGYLSGITWDGPVLHMNYEIDLDARRLEGHDFFCGITFPFGDTHASLILGGWGGYTTGISNVNGIDASENGTAYSVLFEENTWYHICLRITPQRIQAWVENQNIVDVDTSDKSISLRSDVDISVPLSLMTFNTTGAFKNIRIKKL